MSRQLSKKIVHLDLQKYFKNSNTHPYNLRPRRKRINYNEKIFYKTKQSQNLPQIDLSDSCSSKESSRTSLQQDCDGPAEFLTVFVKENFGIPSATHFECVPPNNTENQLPNNRLEEDEDDDDSTASEDDTTSSDPIAGSEDGNGSIRHMEAIRIGQEAESMDTYSNNELHQDGDVSLPCRPVEAENDNEEVVTDSEDGDQLYQFNPNYNVSEAEHPSDLEWEDDSFNIDTNAMGDGPHNVPNVLHFQIDIFEEQEAIPDEDFEY